jgi:hypothetical protein
LTEAPPARRAALLALLLAGLPALAALRGSSAGRELLLNLGPGDAPYIEGFRERYEIDEKVATHWTSYEAVVRLPLQLDGGGELSFRYARVLPETARVEVQFAGETVDRFERRGGIFETRSAPVPAGDRPVHVAFTVDSHDRQRLGLRLDWVRVQPRPGARVRLSGAARWRAALLVAAFVLLLRLAGWSLATTALLSAPLSLLLAAGLLIDPWLTHRLLTGVPELLLLCGLPAVAFGRRLVVRGIATPYAVRALAALSCAAFLMRAAAVNHPAFYYPDLRTHARLVEFVAEGGADFFVHPAKYIAEHGVWRTEAYGRTYAFPYSPAFHLPFVALGLDYDARIAAMKLWAAALSVAPLVLLWALARRLEASVLGAVLMLFVPSYTSRLSYAFLPALFGHAVDMAFLLFLAARLPELQASRRVFAAGVAFVAACQLAYVSGVMNVAVLVAALGACLSLERPVSLARGLRLLAMGLLGSLVSLALYYRDFLPMLADVLPRIAGGAAAPARYPTQPLLSVVAARTHDFFDGVYPLLALAGLALLVLRGVGRSLLLAWTATYFALLLGRAKVPDLFLHGHETLLATPLVCLAAGEALLALWRAGRVGRLGAALLLIFLAQQGLRGQWSALQAQLANAL